MITLTKKLCTRELPAKRAQAVKRYIDIKNYSNTQKVNLKGQSTRKKNFKAENIWQS